MMVEMFPLSGSIPESYFSIFTLGSCQHQPRVRHIIPQIHVGAAAQDLATLLEWDVGFYGNRIGSNDGSVCSSLTLDFSTLRIPDGNKHNTSKDEVNNLTCSKPSPSTDAVFARRGPTWVHIWQRSSWSLSRSCRKGLRQNWLSQSRSQEQVSRLKQNLIRTLISYKVLLIISFELCWCFRGEEGCELHDDEAAKQRCWIRMPMEEFGWVGLPVFVSEQQAMQNSFSSRISQGHNPLANPPRTQKLLANTRQTKASWKVD